MLKLVAALAVTALTVGASIIELYNSPEYIENLLRLETSERDDLGKSERYVTLSDGTKAVGYQRGSVVGFKGLRYAEPPIGSLRWAPPVPWTNPEPGEVYDATRYGRMCIQGFRNAIGSEDCLFLNVWVPEQFFTEGLKDLPVGEML
jgi:hypothetical protein